MEETSSPGNNKSSIDWLPNEVLISILSLLSVKEAARTSVLARRWQYLWMKSRNLDFDGSEMVRKLEIRRKLLESERINFVNWVNKVLNLHSSETIDEFKVSFDLNSGNANDIDRWIGFAFTKKVKRLELNLTPTYLGSFQQERYTFPNIAQSIERLLGRWTCESLVSLRLTRVHVAAEALEFLISNCPFLEELCVKNVIGLEILSPSCQAIRLRHLAIINCHHFIRLEICSPNLVSYEFSAFSGSYIIMALKDVSSLINVSLGARTPRGLSDNLRDISWCLSRLETLTLQTTTMKDDEVLQFPILPRLKKLVLKIHASPGGSLLCFTRLITAAPMLHEMVLKLTWDTSFNYPRPIRRPAEGQTHWCLKVFEIVGFALRPVAAEVALYVLENAASLEKMIIYGKAVTGDGLDELKAKLGRENYAQDIASSVLIM